ncbi:LamG domain-containing protein [Rubinisphaera italica]|uniref:LamG-like jellyroll fold domain-containing protein n=1 Tax=Rubinisphaera italica TaxID=2527969 RepID=A0A5C5XMQ7_9PLAN|nr:LamG domain-containing protein [Rubinisphaera italica]TWT64240.1 hypothetical protein Pan54_50010 [Rubinisphaera italica]
MPDYTFPSALKSYIEGNANSAHFPFTTNGNDVSGNDVHLTLEGSTAIDNGTNVANFGGRPHLYCPTGSSNRAINTTDDFIPDDADFSVSCWLYVSGAGSNDRVFTFGTAANGWYFYKRNTGQYRVQGYYYADFDEFSVGFNIGTAFTGAWNHLVVTYDHSSKTFVAYVNGTSAGSMVMSTGVRGIGTNKLQIYGDAFGAVQEFSLFGGKALTSGEVSELYNSGDGVQWSASSATTYNETASGGIVAGGVSTVVETEPPVVNPACQSADLELALIPSFNSGGTFDFAKNHTITNSGASGEIKEGKYALVFDGTDTLTVPVNANFAQTNAPFSISMFIQSDNTDNPRIIDRSLSEWILTYEGATDQVQFIIKNSSNQDNVISCSVDLSTSKHICVTWDGTTTDSSTGTSGVTMYVDGSPVSMELTRYFNDGPQYDSESAITIGTNLTGWLDDLRFFTKELNTTEVEQLSSKRGYCFEPDVFNEVGSGGAVAGGAASAGKLFEYDTSGGIVAAGISTFTKFVNPEIAGGLVVSGSTSPITIIVIESTGGLFASGSVSELFSPTISGGIVTGGESLISISKIHTVTVTGGCESGGVAVAATNYLCYSIIESSSSTDADGTRARQVATAITTTSATTGVATRIQSGSSTIEAIASMSLTGKKTTKASGSTACSSELVADNHRARQANLIVTNFVTMSATAQEVHGSSVGFVGAGSVSGDASKVHSAIASIEAVSSTSGTALKTTLTIKEAASICSASSSMTITATHFRKAHCLIVSEQGVECVGTRTTSGNAIFVTDSTFDVAGGKINPASSLIAGESLIVAIAGKVQSALFAIAPELQVVGTPTKTTPANSAIDCSAIFAASPTRCQFTNIVITPVSSMLATGNSIYSTGLSVLGESSLSLVPQLVRQAEIDIDCNSQFRIKPYLIPKRLMLEFSRWVQLQDLSFNLYPLYRPRTVALPCGTFTRISSVPLRDLSANSGVVKTRLQIDLFASTYTSLIAINDELRSLLKSYSGNFKSIEVYSIEFENIEDIETTPVDSSDSPEFQRSIDLVITHTETIPSNSDSLVGSSTSQPEAGVVGLLSGIAPVHRRRPQDETETSIVFRRSSTSEFELLNDDVLYSVPNFVIEVVGDNYSAIDPIAAQVRGRLENYTGNSSGSEIWSIRLTNEFDRWTRPIDATDKGEKIIRQQYSVLCLTP